VSAHDTRGDVDPELENVTVIKFAATGPGPAGTSLATGPGPAGASLVVTTYRPETIYGVTNIWVNPKASYVLARHGKETLIISEDAALMLDLQLGLEITGSINADDLLKMSAKNPVTGESVPIWPASFVEPGVGTGIVMSVPAHAPLDYLALRDLGKGQMKMPQVISLKGHGPAPAKEAVERLGVKGQDDPLSEEATKEIYTREAHEGIMFAGEFKGEHVSTAREKIAAKMAAKNDAFRIVTITNGPIKCRCGSPVVVNILKDQWFIDYGTPGWKDKAKECLAAMTIIPEKARSEYLYTIDWLKTRPCTRAAGLGTKFPFDETKMIEALSDSTVYMAYYTIVHLLKDFDAAKLDDKFFDFVILGKGSGNDAMKKPRESFLYWYPVDSRHSAGDLVRNHLTLFIFNHVALMERQFWPRQIVTNGFVLMDGVKMSKSMGNILPLRKAIKEYGADIARFSVVSGAELSTDTDFNRTVAEGVRSRLAFISRLVEDSKKKGHVQHGRIENWLLSRLNRKIEAADRLYGQLAIRDLSLQIFYDVVSDLQWYAKRSKGEANLHDFFTKWVVLMAPFMPHYAEEYWELLGGKGFVSLAPFPVPDASKINDGIERGEELIRGVHGDIEKISGLINKKPSKVTVYIASEWKRRLYGMAKANPSFEALMKAAAAEKLPMKEVQNVAKQIMKKVHSLVLPLSQKEELDALKDAGAFLSTEYSCPVEVLPEEQAKHEKARSALPDKPAIVLE
jgi:leucyl-tRNA synthetase